MLNTPEYYSRLYDIGLELPPVGVKFDFFRPEGYEQLSLDSAMSLCEMFALSQKENQAFYFSDENTETCVGKVLLGMEDFQPFAESGQIGARLKVFNEPRANRHFYQFVRKMDKGTVNYVTFAPASQIRFNPDVLVIAANPEKAEIIMRAVTHSTGEMYESKCTPVMGCSWFLIYPFVTGKVNFIVPALVHGPSGRRLFSPDTLLIGIPYRWIPTVIENLNTMDIELAGHAGKEAYYADFEDILADLSERAKNP